MSFRMIPLLLFLSVQVGMKLNSPVWACGDAAKYTVYSSGFVNSCFNVTVKPEVFGEFNAIDAFPVLKDLDLRTVSLIESC